MVRNLTSAMPTGCGETISSMVDHDPEQFMLDLRDKDALRACPCCGAESEWSTPGDGTVRIPGTVSEEGIEQRVPMSMECAPVVCGNCDFVRLHLLGLPLGQLANFTRKPPSQGKLDRYAPWLFVVLGLAMIAVAAADYLGSAVGVAFAVLGAGLVVVGGLAARIEGTVKLGAHGVELALRAQEVLDEARPVIEQNESEEAKRIVARVDELDDWFEDYKRQVAERPGLDPFARASLMKRTWQKHNPPE